MNDMTSKLEQLELSIQNLIEQTKLLRIENQALKHKNTALEAEVESQKNIIKDIEENNKIVKIAGTISESESDRIEWKARIETYMKEIDRCIALLNS